MAVLRYQPLLDRGNLADHATGDVAGVGHNARQRLQQGGHTVAVTGGKSTIRPKKKHKKHKH